MFSLNTLPSTACLHHEYQLNLGHLGGGTLWYISQNVLSAKWLQGLSMGVQSPGLHSRLLLEYFILPYCHKLRSGRKITEEEATGPAAGWCYWDQDGTWWHGTDTHCPLSFQLPLSLWYRYFHPRYVPPPKSHFSPLGSVSQLGTRCPDVITEMLWYYVLMGARSYRGRMGELGRWQKWNPILLRAGGE